MTLNPRILDWHGRCAWIVGGSTGIGEATARHLHQKGAQVVVSARNATALEAFVDRHPGTIALPLDVTDAGAMRQATRELLARTGRIDLAMYCAGHYRAMDADGFDLDDALKHQAVNYVGALNLLDALLPVLRNAARAGSPGHLSLVASVAGYRGLPRSLAYGPTKAALINLAEALYLELSGEGIGVSIVNPGFVETPLTAQNDFHMPALIDADTAAREILEGWRAGRFEIHFPRRFTNVLKALRSAPDALYFAAVRRATRSRPTAATPGPASTH